MAVLLLHLPVEVDYRAAMWRLYLPVEADSRAATRIKGQWQLYLSAEANCRVVRWLKVCDGSSTLPP
jgi:hypothetical protein